MKSLMIIHVNLQAVQFRLYKTKFCLNYIREKPTAPIQVLSSKIRVGFMKVVSIFSSDLPSFAITVDSGTLKVLDVACKFSSETTCKVFCSALD